MNKCKSYIIGFVCTLCILGSGKAQVISGIVNSYVKVDSIISTSKIKISDVTGFKNGDTVLLIQMRGAEVLEQFQQLNRMKGAGRYEFISIKNINTLNGEVEFRSNMINYTGSSIDDFNAKEGLQMIRVPNYRKAIISSGGLTCKPYDGATFTGGVLAIVVRDTLILNDSIDASFKGFKGGLYTANAGICPTTLGLNYYPPEKTDSAGNKGEGVVSTTFTKTRGKGRYVNAGGGGYGKYSGGGGGGSHGYGGRGGKMDETCPDPNVNSGGQGSQLNSGYFGGTASEYRDRIILGGGGGAGTGTVVGAGTNGGTGGGIVIIVAHTLITNNQKISARGESVPGTTTNRAGAGGGGGGGSVMLAVDNYNGNLNISVPGGKGGNTALCFGMGGGGGGGFIWLKPTTYPTTQFSFSRGDGGFSPCEAAESGGAGKASYNFYPVGLMFNNIYSSQKICYGDIPATIIGSIPNIVDSAKRIFWQQRKKSTQTWYNIPGVTSRDYQPPALFDSTEFRRIVKAKLVQWTDSVADTSLIVTISVVPEIKNNIIDADTSVCYGLPNITLRGKLPNGGNGTFTYKWESNNLVTGWKTAKGISDSQNYMAANDSTMYYRRIVKSDICYSTSDVDTVIVYPLIKDNRIYASQMICENYFPQPFYGTGNDSLSGGNGVFSYKWEKNTNDSSFNARVQVATTQNYAPPRLTEKMYYRRIVISGLNNTCKDTSKWIRIQITPKIDHSKNVIAESQTKCQFITPEPFNGSQPEGGTGAFIYQWQRSIDQFNWVTDTVSSNLKNYGPKALLASTHFRRIVLSGINNCCKDTSNQVLITVQPAIANNIIKTSFDTICQNQAPAQFIQSSGAVSGGIGPPFTYTWQQKPLNGPGWVTATGSTNNISYNPPVLTQTMHYRRIAASGVCTHQSDSLTIRVLETLVGNTLVGNNEVCRDLPAAIITGGSMLKGDGIYRYSWQDSIPGKNWRNNIPDITPNYAPGVLDSSKYFRRIVKSGKNDCCISISEPFEIKINELPIGVLSSKDTAFCQGNSLLAKVTITSGNAPFSLSLTGKSVQFPFSSLNSGVNSLDIQPQTSDSIIIGSIVDAKGCVAVNKTGVLKIRLVAVPVANAGNNKSVCGLKAILDAIPSVGIGYWNALTGSAVFDVSPTKFNDSVKFETYGDHTLQWIEINEMCSDSDKVVITFFEQPQTPKLGLDTSLYYTYDFGLNAPEPAVGSGNWTSLNNIFISNPVNPVTEAKNLNFGNNFFVWTVINGVCPSVSDTILVYRDDIKRYSGFSPNGDGINDEFVIEGLDNAAHKKITIMNRWGGVVFSSNNYNNTWDGKNNSGNLLPDDTYFYVLIVDNSREYKGFIVLKR